MNIRFKLDSLFCVKTCNICGYNGKFNDFGLDYPIFKEKMITGGGPRKNVLCPACGANDRQRFVDYVLSKYTDIYTGENVVLHIAPEAKIKEKITKNTKCKYIDGDLNKDAASNVIDVTDIHFDDGYFDYIIINHVLEHIPDERKAIEELSRCLKKDGRIIFSFPVCLKENTYEDPDIIKPEDRVRSYGQEDHVRLYGEKDIEQRFLKYGIVIETIRASEEFNNHLIRKYAYPKKDFVFVGRHKYEKEGSPRN